MNCFFNRLKSLTYLKFIFKTDCFLEVLNISYLSYILSLMQNYKYPHFLKRQMRLLDDISCRNHIMNLFEDALIILSSLSIVNFDFKNFFHAKLNRINTFIIIEEKPMIAKTSTIF